MKILNTTPITSSNAMPVKSGTLQFMQDAHKETTANILTNLLPNPVANTVYIISGCKNTATLPAHNITAGVLYYNGEVYNFDGASFTLTGLQKAYARIQTTQFITNADPVQFTDGVSRNVHDIRKVVIENTITSSGLPEFKDFILINNWLKGDTKEVVCDSTYLNVNFDSTGLGRLERLGWAIMNGSNGTPNDNGKVVIAYGSDYLTLGATGGSEDAVNVTHQHFIANTDGVTNPALTASNYLVRERDASGNPPEDYVLAGSNTVATTGLTSPSGVSGTGKNMQPYVVRLRIMKL
jgi:hypothetical protein